MNTVKIETLINEQAQGVHSLINKTATNEGNLSKSALILLKSVMGTFISLENFDNWLDVSNGKEVTAKGYKSILTAPLLGLTQREKGHKVGAKITQKFSEYTANIVADMGMVLLTNPTELHKHLKGVDLSVLKLSDYLRLLKAIQKIGSIQNKEINEETLYTWKNINFVATTKEVKIFEMFKSAEILATEQEIKDNQAKSGNASKVVRAMLKEVTISKDSKEEYTAGLDALFAKSKEALLAKYDADVAEALKAEEVETTETEQVAA